MDNTPNEVRHLTNNATLAILVWSTFHSCEEATLGALDETPTLTVLEKRELLKSMAYERFRLAMDEWCKTPHDPVLAGAVRGRWMELGEIEDVQKRPPVQPMKKRPPRLWADGKRDDTYGVQWYLDHDLDLPLPLTAYKVDLDVLRFKTPPQIPTAVSA